MDDVSLQQSPYRLLPGYPSRHIDTNFHENSDTHQYARSNGNSEPNWNSKLNSIADRYYHAYTLPECDGNARSLAYDYRLSNGDRGSPTY
ncbi:MAG: hypothetical protein GHCLOJNM_02869 [bacterium]|nr:hypothetical protein [bacterium]